MPHMDSTPFVQSLGTVTQELTSSTLVSFGLALLIFGQGSELVKAIETEGFTRSGKCYTSKEVK